MRLKNRTILPRILATVANAAVAFGAPSALTSAAAYRAFRKFEELQDLTDKQLQQTVRHAIAKKYIVLKGRSGHKEIVLTEQGRRLAGREALRGLRPPIPNVWDRKWRIVMFDIPEFIKPRRDGFAKNLKDLGCTQIQKSVFVLPYPCFEEVEVLLDFYDIRPFVSCILAEKILNDTELRRIFSLPSRP